MFKNYSETRIYRFFRVLFLALFLLILAIIITAALSVESGSAALISIIFVTGFLLWLVIYTPVRRIFTAARGLHDAGGFAVGGRARFAGFMEENASAYKTGTGIFYGYSLHPPYRQVGSTDDRHMLTFAGSRSGKGVSCIIPNLLLWEGSAFCIDPKGTNTHVTAQRRREMGQDVHILDPFGMVGGQTDRFNPLDILDPDDLTIMEDIRMIARSIVVSEEGKDGHFSDSANDIISGYIGHVISSGLFANPSLYDVLELVQLSTEGQALLHADMMINPACGGLIKLGAQRILETQKSNEYLSVRATILRNLSWMTSQGMRSCLTQSTFALRALKVRPTTVYLVLPPDMLDEHKRFMRMIIAIIMSRYAREGKAAVPGLLIIDEAPRLGYLKELAAAYGVMASSNMVVWSFFQDKGQLDKLYGTEAQSFVGSSRAVQIFGVRDTDAKWVSEMLGTRGMRDADAMDRSSAILNLRDPGSVAKEVGRANRKLYIIPGDEPPFILGRKPYYKDRNFKHMAAPDPDYA